MCFYYLYFKHIYDSDDTISQCDVSNNNLGKVISMENTKTATEYANRREIFMKPFKGNNILEKKIPEIAAGLMKAEFGINIFDHSHIPIIFTTAWREILKAMGSENVEECRADVCGVSIEYTTEHSESDKSTNIVPQMYHKKTPLFSQNDNQELTLGVSYTDKILEKYNSWRSVYAMEALTGIENKVFDEILNEYGINIMQAAAIYPILGATYAAGVQLARETGQTINMYNIFEIDIVEDKTILTPLAFVKQFLKNDSKKF